MATVTEHGGAAIPIGRLIARAARLSSPSTLVVLGLLTTGLIGTDGAITGLLAGFLFGGILAFFRERRLQSLENQLFGITAHMPRSAGGFTVLAGDELPIMIGQVKESLKQMQARQAELDRTLAAILEALPDPIMLVTGARRVDRANQAAVQLFEYDIVGRLIEVALRDPGLLAAIDDALEINEPTEINLQLPGPPARAFGAQVIPISWHQSPAVLISLRELTEQVMIERMRADFVANASHELRTPLTVLRGFIETLTGAAKDDPEAQARFLKTMATEAERMSRLVNDLLSLSRIEQNEHITPEGSVDLKQSIGGVVDALRGYADTRRVRLKSDLPDDLPTLNGDFDQLTQLFTNLIDNAIKYGGEDGAVDVVVRYDECMPLGAGALNGRPAVEVKVIDDGPGIEPEYLPRLTERFFRVDPALSRHLGSTGLGLAIVKHILRRHRGHLSIESVVGEGTTFIVYLPAPDAQSV